VSQLSAAGVPVLGYEGLLAAGAQLRAAGPFQPAVVGRSSLATLVYTSGTTGRRVWCTWCFVRYLPQVGGDGALCMLPDVNAVAAMLLVAGTCTKGQVGW
jgi:hypothetical protein